MLKRKPSKRARIDKKFPSLNGCAKNIVNAIIKRVLPKQTSTNDVISNEEKDKTQTVFINVDYLTEKVNIY